MNLRVTSEKLCVSKTHTMKKILSLLVFTLVVATGCKSQSASARATKLEQSDVSYEYKAYTRGKVLSISINRNKIFAGTGNGVGDMNGPVVTMTADKWSSLLSETAKLNLDKLETLEVPSKKHQFDGAMAANLKITVDGKEYSTQTFDHGNPPAEIKPLVDKMIQISELNNQ